MTKKTETSDRHISTWDEGFIHATVKRFGDLAHKKSNISLANLSNSADVAQRSMTCGANVSVGLNCRTGLRYVATRNHSRNVATGNQRPSEARYSARPSYLDRRIVYPLFQFRGREVIAGLSDVLKLTKDKVDDWTLASWLVVPQSTTKALSTFCVNVARPPNCLSAR